LNLKKVAITKFDLHAKVRYLVNCVIKRGLLVLVMVLVLVLLLVLVLVLQDGNLLRNLVLRKVYATRCVSFGGFQEIRGST
jgi:hypothetical protein